MTAYITSFLSAIFGGLLCSKFKIKKNKKLLCIIFTALPLVVLSAVRENIGTDYANYVKIFTDIRDYGHLDSIYFGTRSIEPLYFLLNKVISWFHGEPQWVFVITSLVYVVTVVYVCYDASPYPLFSVFLLMGTTAYFEQFNTMRQHLGCVLLLLSLLYVFQRKPIKFLILVFIAGMLHYVCLLFLPVYFINKIKVKPRHMVIGVIAFAVLQRPIIQIAYALLSNTQYVIYIDDQVGSGVGLVGILAQLVIFGLMTVMYREEPEYKTLYVLEAISLMITFLLSSVPLIGRVRWVFFYPVVILGIPFAVKKIKNGYLRFGIKLALVLFFCVYAYVTIVVNRGYGVYPYQSIFD